jgi:hypothetical protein
MKRVLLGTLLTLLSLSSVLLGHHAAAGIDRTKTVTIEGVVKQFKWGNPHSWMDIEVPNAKGSTDIWSLEMTAPAFLVRAGWKSTTVKAGDKVKATARPFKNGDPGGLFLSVTLPDGRTLTEQAPARGATTAPAPAGPAAK